MLKRATLRFQRAIEAQVHSVLELRWLARTRRRVSNYYEADVTRLSKERGPTAIGTRVQRER